MANPLYDSFDDGSHGALGLRGVDAAQYDVVGPAQNPRLGDGGYMAVSASQTAGSVGSMDNSYATVAGATPYDVTEVGASADASQANLEPYCR